MILAIYGHKKGQALCNVKTSWYAWLDFPKAPMITNFDTCSIATCGNSTRTIATRGWGHPIHADSTSPDSTTLIRPSENNVRQ